MLFDFFKKTLEDKSLIKKKKVWLLIMDAKWTFPWGVYSCFCLFIIIPTNVLSTHVRLLWFSSGFT